MNQEIELFVKAAPQVEEIEVTFYDHRQFLDGDRYEVHFANGFGASVIRTTGSYGGREGLFELAVLDENSTKTHGVRWGITHDTPITGDVLGWLNETEVIDTLKKIAKL